MASIASLIARAAGAGAVSVPTLVPFHEGSTYTGSKDSTIGTLFSVDSDCVISAIHVKTGSGAATLKVGVWNSATSTLMRSGSVTTTFSAGLQDVDLSALTPLTAGVDYIITARAALTIDNSNSPAWPTTRTGTGRTFTLKGSRYIFGDAFPTTALDTRIIAISPWVLFP